MTQTVEIQAGMEYTLLQGPRVTTGNSGAFRGVLSVIFGGGVVTPLNSSSNASIFTLNYNLGNQFTDNAQSTNNSSKSFANTYPTLAAALCGHYGYFNTGMHAFRKYVRQRGVSIAGQIAFLSRLLWGHPSADVLSEWKL
jgi:hypothetical protein